MDELREDGVRIGLRAIYDKVMETREEVRSVKQSVEESIKPALTDTRSRVTLLEVRVYAILAGLIAAIAAGKGLGLL